MSQEFYNSYELFRKTKEDSGTIAEFHFKRILAAIYKKLTPRQTFRNQYKFGIVEPMMHSHFLKVFQAIRDFKNNHGVQPYVGIKTIRDKPGRRGTVTQTFIITFEHYYSFLHHFTHLINKNGNILGFVTKKVKNCDIEVVVTKEKPFVMTYKIKTETLAVSGHFIVKNEFGNICSF